MAHPPVKSIDVCMRMAYNKNIAYQGQFIISFGTFKGVFGNPFRQIASDIWRKAVFRHAFLPGDAMFLTTASCIFKKWLRRF